VGTLNAPPPASAPADDATVNDPTDIDRFLAPGALRPLFQPIVDLATGEVVAFEALARWPDVAGGEPDDVFATARATGRTVELDWACRLAALEEALAQGLGREHMLFVNVEPATIATVPPPGADVVVAAAREGLRVMLELTERALTDHPAELLGLVGWARRQGWSVALDDVGAAPESLALLPLLAPEVIKLDISLVQRRPNADQAAVMAAVMAHSERTGAVVLAEGVETAAHADQALALGATLGQGWRFGRPGPLTVPPPSSVPIPPARPHPTIASTPFQLLAGRATRVGRKGLLLDLSLHVEQLGMQLHPAPVVISAFQTAARFTPATAARSAALAARCPLVVALATGLDRDAVPGVHGGAIGPADDLAGEWTVVVVGTHHAAALIALDLGDDGDDQERRFEFVVTHDRDLVLAAARSLMARVTAAPGPDDER
jgi:EAL domain-containing protein (putative c-di-GMP-specific phosphodiesterase class I)